MHALALLLATSIAQASEIYMNIYCRSSDGGNSIALRNQELAAELFEHGGIEFVKTNADGVLSVNKSMAGDKFRLDGFANGEIIPGCNSGLIHRIKNNLTVTLSGLDCGLVAGCDESRN